MLDVHLPHASIHGWRDFLIHLATITIGLLIALSLEGYVEWQHHRHLVHEAEASLHDEIKANAAAIDEAAADIHKQQADLKHDVSVLKEVIQTHHLPKNGSMSIAFHIRGFESVSWKTAQSTGALSYMPYATAQEYSDIYGLQDLLSVQEQLAARDAILSLGPFMNPDEKNPDPTPEQATVIIDHIQVLQGQLLLVDSLVTGLDDAYKKFLRAHS